MADLQTVLRELGPVFASRIDEHDAQDTFVAANFADLRARGVLAAGVPAELGGGGNTQREICDFLRELARSCSSTALALSMHMHQVMIPAWRWRNEGGVGEPLLRRVAAENLLLVTSGGSDWIDSSGTLEKVDGGYRFTARKIFASGSPAGDLFMTSGIYDDPTDGPTVLHFGLPLSAEGVHIQDNWRTLGMRGTGSNDIVIDGAFIPDAAVTLRRPKGKWGIYHTIAMVALPIIYSVYVGIAERARELAIEAATKRREDPVVRQTTGELENHLRQAQVMLASAIDISENAKPGPDTTNEMLIRRTLIANAVLGAVSTAMSVAGGASYFRSFGLERLWRDIQAARFHPLPEKRQLEYTGRYTLGLEID